MGGGRLRTARFQLSPPPPHSVLRTSGGEGEGIPFQGLKKKTNTKLPLLSALSPVTLQQRREVPTGSLLQRTRDSRRRASEGRQSSQAEAPGSSQWQRPRPPPSAPRPAAAGGHRAPLPSGAGSGATAPGPRTAVATPLPGPRRETCNKRRGSRGTHWPAGAGRGGASA